MTQAWTQERATPKRRNGAAHGAVVVSGYTLARHFGITRQSVDALATQGVIERRPDDHKFDQDASRLRYFAHLRAEHRRSPRLQADADHIAAKAEMLRIKIMQQQRVLVLREDADAMIDTLVGIVLTALSGLPARCSRDPSARRNIALAVDQVRREMAQVCETMADKNGEPSLLDQQRQAQETATADH